MLVTLRSQWRSQRFSIRLDSSLSDPRPLIEAHGELVRLSGEQSTYNYDPGLLAMEIGTLLARAAGASERVDG